MIESAHSCLVSRRTFLKGVGLLSATAALVPYKEGPTYENSTYSSPADPGSRVTITDVAGRGFSQEEKYTIATLSFLCDGGDTYRVFKDASDAEKPVVFGFDYEAMASYLVEGCNHTVPADYEQPRGRITISGLS